MRSDHTPLSLVVDLMSQSGDVLGCTYDGSLVMVARCMMIPREMHEDIR